MRKSFLLLLLLSTIFSAAQNKPVIFQQQAWVGYYPQVKFSKHLGIWFDSEIHTNDHYFNGFSQATFRLAGTYYNNKLNKFTVGYGYTDYFPGDNHKHISIPEHFGWQQYQWFSYFNKRKLMQWIRLEEKFRDEALDDYTTTGKYTVTYRARYNIYCQIPLSPNGIVAHSLSVAVGDEVYLYYSPHDQNNIFDQNRVFLGLSYSLNGHNNLVFGVMNMLQEDISGQLKDNNVLRLSLFQNLGRMKRVE